MIWRRQQPSRGIPLPGAGTGQSFVFTQTEIAGESKRYWRIEFKEGGL